MSKTKFKHETPVSLGLLVGRKHKTDPLSKAEERALVRAVGLTYDQWQQKQLPRLLEVGDLILARLEENIDKLPPVMLIQYLQQIHSLAGKPIAGVTHNHLHLGERSKEELLAIMRGSSPLPAESKKPALDVEQVLDGSG